MRILCHLFFASVFVPALWAYDVDKDSGGYVDAWEPGTIPMRILLPTPSITITDGTNYISSVQAAMQSWNTKLGVVQFTWQATTTPSNPPAGTYVSGNQLNEIAMDSQYYSGADREDFGTNVLAITLTYTQGNTRVESDIVFNSAYTWNSYRGNLTSQQDIQRVAIHELGHTLGLKHPDQASPQQSVSAIMNSTISSIDTMRPDDINGAQLLYAAPGFVPANNNFSSATTISLTGNSIQLTGTNVAATRQSGEPIHAGANATNGHSVWWKWTAPGDGSTTITTLGSNFDTVLAVYTGSAVTTLNSVASNDDAQNDANGHIRTSTVTFTAVSGTTYSIAVDGWGSSSQSDQFTFTGAITLNLDYAGAVGTTAPSITTQPTSQTVVTGAAVTFTAAASGNPAPTFQWRKNGANISGATNSSYTIPSATVAHAGSYTVVATNSLGSATSNPAVLTIIVAPSSAVITITVQ